VENRTIYTILAKPVRRFEFLLGKFFGSLLLLVLSMMAMSILFGAVLWIKEQGMIHELSQTYLGESAADKADARQQIKQLETEAVDLDLVKAIAADLAKATLVASITLLVSTFSTSLVFNVVVPFMVFVAGMLRGTAVEMWGGHQLLMAVLAIVPDFGLFSIADEINLGNVVPWMHVGEIITYGLARTMIVVVAAHLIFSRREI
jgi:ABC-type transport system involved in multi-copper enzyme maturation permease subunit